MATKAATKKSSKSTSDTAIDLPSEKELLAMPESDYMNERQLAFFRNGSNNSNRTSWPTPARPPSTCGKPSSCRTLPTAPRSRKNTRWNCARAIASASCSRRCNSPSPASTAANTAGVRKPANPSASPPAGPPHGHPVAGSAGTPRNASKTLRRLSLPPKRLRASPGAPLRTRRFRPTPRLRASPCIFSVVRTGHVTRFPLGQTLSSPSLSMECVSWAVFLVARTVVGTQVVRINKAGSRKTCPIRFL